MEVFEWWGLSSIVNQCCNAVVKLHIIGWGEGGMFSITRRAVSLEGPYR